MERLKWRRLVKPGILFALAVLGFKLGVGRQEISFPRERPLFPCGGTEIRTKNLIVGEEGRDLTWKIEGKVPSGLIKAYELTHDDFSEIPVLYIDGNFKVVGKHPPVNTKMWMVISWRGKGLISPGSAEEVILDIKSIFDSRTDFDFGKTIYDVRKTFSSEVSCERDFLVATDAKSPEMNGLEINFEEESGKVNIRAKIEDLTGLAEVKIFTGGEEIKGRLVEKQEYTFRTNKFIISGEGKGLKPGTLSFEMVDIVGNKSKASFPFYPFMEKIRDDDGKYRIKVYFPPPFEKIPIRGARLVRGRFPFARSEECMIEGISATCEIMGDEKGFQKAYIEVEDPFGNKFKLYLGMEGENKDYLVKILPYLIVSLLDFSIIVYLTRKGWIPEKFFSHNFIENLPGLRKSDPEEIKKIAEELERRYKLLVELVEGKKVGKISDDAAWYVLFKVSRLDLVFPSIRVGRFPDPIEIKARLLVDLLSELNMSSLGQKSMERRETIIRKFVESFFGRRGRSGSKEKFLRNFVLNAYTKESLRVIDNLLSLGVDSGILRGVLIQIAKEREWLREAGIVNLPGNIDEILTAWKTFSQGSNLVYGILPVLVKGKLLSPSGLTEEARRKYVNFVKTLSDEMRKDTSAL